MEATTAASRAGAAGVVHNYPETLASQALGQGRTDPAR